MIWLWFGIWTAGVGIIGLALKRGAKVLMHDMRSHDYDAELVRRKS